MSGGWGDMFCRRGVGGEGGRGEIMGRKFDEREEGKVGRKYDSRGAGFRFFKTVGAMAYGLWKTWWIVYGRWGS